MEKMLIDFSIEEAINVATKGFGKMEVTSGNESWSDSVRHALQMVIDFKISQKQDEISKRLLRLTKWLVGLTIALVALTVVLLFLTYKLSY